MTDLYDQRIDAMSPDDVCDIALDNMRVMENSVEIRCRMQDSWQFTRNADRLAAYKRKRAAWGLEGPLV